MALPGLLGDAEARRNEVIAGINSIGQWTLMDESGDLSPAFTSAKKFVECANRELISAVSQNMGMMSAAFTVTNCGFLEL